MRARGHHLAARALMRARIRWVAAGAVGATLYARVHPGMRVLPEAALVLSGCLVALVLAHGVVERDLRAGATLLWLQKPGRAGTFYAGRLATLALMVPAVHALVGLALVGAGLVPTAPSPGLAVTLALLDLAVVSTAFCMSAAGVPLAPLAAVLWIVLVGLPGADAALDPSRFGALNPWLAFPRFPVLELRGLRGWMEGASAAPPGSALLRPLLYPLAGAALGVILVEARLRVPGWGGMGSPTSREPSEPRSPAPPPAPAPRG